MSTGKKVKAALSILLTAITLFMLASTPAGILNYENQKAQESVIAAESASEVQIQNAGSVEEATEIIKTTNESKAKAGKKTSASECPYSPTIILPGIGQSTSTVYGDDGKPVQLTNLDGTTSTFESKLFLIDPMSVIISAVVNLVVPMITMLITQKDAGFTDAVYKVAKKALEVQTTNPDGSFDANIRTEYFPGPVSTMPESKKSWLMNEIPLAKYAAAAGEDHCYFFPFNVIGKPTDTVKKLHDYVQLVKQQTGHDKVNFINLSLGGSIFTLYLDMYGHEDLDSVVSVVAAHDGTTLIADMMERNFILDDEFVHHVFIPKILGQNSGDETMGYLLNIILRIIPKSIFEKTLTRAIDGVLEAFILNNAQFWAMVPSDRYDALAQRYLSDDIHKELRVLTDRFHHAQLNLESNLKEAKADGVKLNFICGADTVLGEGYHDYKYFTIMASNKTENSDGIIQLSSTSIGATAVYPGTTFPADYEQSKNYAKDPSYSYISPGRTVDVSTALFPDNTWIFLNQHHEAARNTVVINLVTALLLDSELVDVHSKPDEWPQFNYSCNNHELRKLAIRARDTEKIEEASFSAEDKIELAAAIKQADKQLNSTIANQADADAAYERLNAIMNKYELGNGVKEIDKNQETYEAIAKVLSWICLQYYGGNGFSDGGSACNLIKGALEYAGLLDYAEQYNLIK